MTDETTGSNEKNGKTWPRRTLSDLLKRGKRGDIVAAYVGEGARDVVIGKNIIKIGTLVIPTVPVLAILFVVVSALIFVAVNFLGPAKMDARFNVAVAQVGEVDAEGRMHRSEDGKLLSKWIFDELMAANEKYENSGVEIWHDSLSLLEKRVKLGMVSGQTPEARAEAASELASKVDADVVIYGHLTPHESPAQFVLEFYVKPRVRGEANVTIGRYQLGEPIPIPESFRTDTLAKEALGTRVANRAGALFWLLLGLREDLLGRSEEALAIFRQTEEELTHWKEQGEGKETLYFFIGRSALFLERYEEAEEALEKALSSNPTHARAHIVLGSVDFRRVQGLLLSHEKQPLEPQELEQAIIRVEQTIEHYQKGVELAQESHEPLIEIIGRLALASAYRFQGQVHFLLQDSVEANHFFDLAIEEVNQVLDPLTEAKQYRILAQAYQNLGAAYTQQAQVLQIQGDVAGSRTRFEAARAAYAGCVEQGEKAPEDEILQLDVIADAEQGCQHWDEVVEEILLTLEGD
jgi:tetratricopeptide (TPR) repeat protein